MARYTGPRDKISRRFGVPLFGPSKALERKAYAPGMPVSYTHLTLPTKA